MSTPPPSIEEQNETLKSIVRKLVELLPEPEPDYGGGQRLEVVSLEGVRVATFRGHESAFAWLSSFMPQTSPSIHHEALTSDSMPEIPAWVFAKAPQP